MNIQETYLWRGRGGECVTEAKPSVKYSLNSKLLNVRGKGDTNLKGGNSIR